MTTARSAAEVQAREVEAKLKTLARKEHNVAIIAAALSAARREAWQPIETAPRDGTLILVYDSYRDHEIVGFDGKGWSRDSDGQVIYPRCWMPLPEGPAAAIRTRGEEAGRQHKFMSGQSILNYYGATKTPEDVE